jgi:LuxR family transcriptional regulator, maltose regulon positive regulatory protein
MKAPTIPEKFRTPLLPANYLPRPRLDRLWEQRREKRVVLVTAGAGYGKSSFLAARAAAEGSFLWYRLDEEDGRLSSFTTHLVQLLSCSDAFGEADEAPLDPVRVRRVLAGVTAALRARGRTLLVLDDAHLLRLSPEVLGFLSNLVRLLPPDTTLVLSSREPLGIGTSRALVEGRASTIDARDLEFRADEVGALFALRFGSPPSARQCRRILAATEGWAAGLEILFQALDSPSPAAVDEALGRLLRAGSGWFDYFAEEVVGRLEEGMGDFLRRTSLLPRLDPAICDRVLGRSDSREILEQLVRRSLFTLREGVEGAYRYHLLFRSYLREALSREMPAEAQRRLCHDAAQALLRADEVAGALDLFVQANDPGTTLRLIEKKGEALLAAGRYEVVDKALKIIPPARLRRSPPALFVQGRLLDYLGRWDEAESIYRRILTLKPSGALKIELYSILGQIASRWGDHTRAFSLCQVGLKQRGARRARAQGRLLNTIGISACKLGRLDEGERYLEKARALLTRHHDLAGQAQIDYILVANVHLPRGEFGRGREAARRALARLREAEDPRRTCICLTVLSWVTVLAGEAGEARDYATEARRLAETLGLKQIEAFSQYVLGYCSHLEGDSAGARQYLEEAIRIGDRVRDSDNLILPRLLYSECLLAAGNRQQALSLVQEALEIARRLKDPLQQAQCQVLLGLSLLGEDRDGARNCWRRAEKSLRALGARFDLHRLLLLRLGEEQMRPAERSRLLAELLEGSARLEHDSLFLLMDPGRAVRVLPDALGLESGHEYAASLLVRLGERAVKEIQLRTQDPDEQSRSRAVELLAQIGGPRARTALARLAKGDAARPSARLAREELARAPVRPLHIVTLGPFGVRVGDEPVPDDRWRSARARRLFQYLLVEKFRWVTHDQIMETLWPEADPDKARGSLWQSVFRLRRVLEPDLQELRVSRYVRASEDSYRLEPGDGSTCDALEFEDSIRKADRLAAARRGRAAEALYRRALDLYQGEFLAESPYEEFAASERERLRDLLVRASVRLSDLYASSRQWAECIPICRSALGEDPYNEELHYHLLRAQVSLGHRKEALDVYREFEARMAGELNLVPSSRMQALVEQIRAARKGSARPA